MCCLFTCLPSQICARLDGPQSDCDCLQCAGAAGVRMAGCAGGGGESEEIVVCMHPYCNIVSYLLF